EVKAVEDGYPLRGQLRVAEEAFGVETATRAIPAPGTAWLDARMLQALGVRVGDDIHLGAAQLRVAAVLAYEPDRGGDLFSIAPRVLLNYADLPATQLTRAGSRLTHRLLVAGDKLQVERFRAWLVARLKPGERLQDIREGRPELRAALDRAGQFLGLTALVSVLLAGVAVATSARRYSARHLDSVAVLRCLGASQATVVKLFLFEMLWLGLLASLAGCAFGYAAQAGLAYLLSGLVATTLPAPTWSPVAAGLVTGLVTLLGFALAPLLRLKDVPPLRVLRRDLGALPPRGVLPYAAACAALGALMWWQAGDNTLALYVMAGTLGGLVLLGGMAYALVRALNVLRQRVGVAWRYGLANIARRAQGSVVQVVAFGLGIMVLLLLSLVRADLLRGWQNSLPPDAPNQFIINIQPDEVAPLQAFFSERERPAPAWYPVVRGRLATINGRPADPEAFANPRAKRLLEHEFNLSWSAALQADNRIVAGRWWSAGERGAWLSIEKGLAETLQLKLGDELGFLLGGSELRATVMSLRSVEWDSFRPNFFVLAPPGLLDEYPATYMTSFYLPKDDRVLLGALAERFPSVTLLDVDALMTQVRRIVDRVVLAVEYVFLFSLLAGLVVLYAAIQATQDERLYESAMLRTLGAGRRQVQAGLIAEFVTLGLLAGLLASLTASLLGYMLAEQVLHIAYQFNVWLWVAGILGGALGIGLAGTLATRFVLEHPPWRVLREI
ncbi:MAG: ABC transporter permease, partial [Candidatus Muproteobacteria bacterium RBG_16_64_11]